MIALIYEEKIGTSEKDEKNNYRCLIMNLNFAFDGYQCIRNIG